MNRLAIVIAAALWAASTAQAGRPLQAEDAGVLESGACEVEGATQHLREPGTASLAQNSLQLSCGVGLSSHLALAVSRARADGTSTDGLRFGGKSELWHGAGDAPAAFTLAWGLRSERAAGHWRHAANELNAVLSVPMDDLTGHLNLGHVRDVPSRVSTTTWALALEHAGFGSLAPMGELFGDDRGAPWWNLGVRWTAIPGRAFLDMSYGRQIVHDRPTLWTAGFRFAF